MPGDLAAVDGDESRFPHFFQFPHHGAAVGADVIRQLKFLMYFPFLPEGNCLSDTYNPHDQPAPLIFALLLKNCLQLKVPVFLKTVCIQISPAAPDAEM